MQETSTLFTKRRFSPYLIFFLLCLFLYLPSSFLREPFPPDEVRFLTIAKSMHSLKDYLFPEYLGSPYYDKPPFYFWVLNFFLKFNLDNPLILVVLFNSLISWAILSLNYLFFKKEGSDKIGFLSSLILATTSIFYGMSVVLRMDILFLFFTLVSIYSFLFYLKSKRVFLIFISSLSCFLAVFTKGALGIVFPFCLGVSSGLILKDKKIIKKTFLVYSLSFILILVWLVSFSLIDKNYFPEMFYKQTILRGVGRFGHIHSFFYYFPFLFLLFLPYTFLGLTSLFLNPESFWEKLFLVWFIGGFLILSFFSSKHPIYLLILSPSFSGLLSRFLLEENKESLKRSLFYLSGGFFLILWVFSWVYFKFKGYSLPSSSILILILFITLNILISLKKKGLAQFKIFFTFWVVLLQLVSFLYLPLITTHLKTKKPLFSRNLTHYFQNDMSS